MSLAGTWSGALRSASRCRIITASTMTSVALIAAPCASTPPPATAPTNEKPMHSGSSARSHPVSARCCTNWMIDQARPARPAQASRPPRPAIACASDASPARTSICAVPSSIAAPREYRKCATPQVAMPRTPRETLPT
jgi:hypothetical protein